MLTVDEQYVVIYDRQIGEWTTPKQTSVLNQSKQESVDPFLFKQFHDYILLDPCALLIEPSDALTFAYS